MTILEEIDDWIAEKIVLWDMEPKEIFQSIRMSLHFGGRIVDRDFPLVTCKDCANCHGYEKPMYGIDDGSMVEFLTCELGHGCDTPIGETVVGEDDFCSWAERREK